MEELCLEICLHFESGQINLKTLAMQFEDLNQILAKATSRFVDIDSSTKDDLFLFQKMQENLAAIALDKKLQEDLFNVYEALKNYLGLKFKYGEAADWYLKNEYDSHLIIILNQLSFHNSSK